MPHRSQPAWLDVPQTGLRHSAAEGRALSHVRFLSHTRGCLAKDTDACFAFRRGNLPVTPERAGERAFRSANHGYRALDIRRSFAGQCHPVAEMGLNGEPSQTGTSGQLGQLVRPKCPPDR